jgi:hypothetical protein
MSSSTSPLPERYRLAYNITPGFELQGVDNEWIRVERQLHITFPANIVTFALADGRDVTFPARTKLMSRRPQLEVSS